MAGSVPLLILLLLLTTMLTTKTTTTMMMMMMMAMIAMVSCHADAPTQVVNECPPDSVSRSGLHSIMMFL